MPRWLFVGPTLMAGIGQVTYQYSQCVKQHGHESDFVTFGNTVPDKDYDIGFGFVLPIVQHMALVDEMLKRCKKKMYMTICETETVHPIYGILVDRYKTLWTPSQFCVDVFSRQFPQGDWKLLRLYAPEPEILPIVQSRPYTFYTIGNVIDPRKNTKMLLEAFIRMPKKPGEARLLIKATCKQPFNVKIPDVHIINGLLTDEEMESQVHAHGDCYINCSHSEGVGMGAFEAALRSKPVIISEYGGLKEYVHTPFIIDCDREPVGQDDFLFQRDMIWGKPNLDSLVRHMSTCLSEKICTYNHSYSINLNKDTVYSLLSYTDSR